MAVDDEILDEEEEEEYNIPAIIIAMVIALILIGAGVWYFVLREKPEEVEKEAPVWEAPEEGFQEEDISDALPQMVINPSDSGGRYYLILKLNIALNDRDLVKDEILRKPWRLARTKNIIYDICNSYRVEELRTPKVKEEIRRQIADSLNEMLGWSEEQAKEEAAMTGKEMRPPPVKEVYFEEYILQ